MDRPLPDRIRDGEPTAIAEVFAALLNHGGNVSHATKALGLPWRKFQRWRNEIPELGEAVERGIREGRDIARATGRGKPAKAPSLASYDPDDIRAVVDQLCASGTRSTAALRGALADWMSSYLGE